MAIDQERRLEALCRQLNEIIMGAALCATEIASIVNSMHDRGGTAGATPNGQHLDRRHTGRPLMDESTLSVMWNGKMLHLGHTQGFWLLARLARSANQYVTHLDLIADIWDNDLTDPAAVRSGVRRLRLKLRRGGMRDLADAIVGHHGRYMLDLGFSSRHTEVTASAH